MVGIYFQKRELKVITDALRDREDRMFRDAQEYKKQDNKLAQFDCIHKMYEAKNARERLEKYLRQLQCR